MSSPPPSVVERLRARNPLPAGTVVAGIGFAIAGITIYVFLAISARTLGAERYAPLSAMWAITFLAAPGFFFPLEQEVARALSARRVRGEGGRPVVIRAVLLALAFIGVLGVGAAAGAGPLINDFFEGETLLFVGFLAALVAYAVEHITRGTLAGSGRFVPYGVLLSTEGVIRMLGAIALAVGGIATAGPYGLVVGLAPLIAVALVVPKERDVLEPGPEAPWSEFSRAFVYLLIGNVMALAMINIAPLIVTALGNQEEKALAGAVLIGLIVARIPVFMFQAVQATLIPQLAGFATAGEWGEFRSHLLRLLAALAAAGGLFTAGAAAVGPWVIGTFFGEEFRLGNADMAYLAAASATFMLAMALAQALIAISGYRRAAAGWVFGMGVLFLAIAVPGDLLFRTERAFLAGAVAAMVAMAILLAEPVRRGVMAGDPEFAVPEAMPE